MTAGEQLAASLVAALDDGALVELAQRLVPHLPVAERREDGWLDAKAAARYLGLPSVAAINKLTGARALRFSQESPGAKTYFERCDLDEYRRRHMHGPA